MVLLELRKDKMRGRKMGNSIVICLGNASGDESAKGAIVRLPDFVHFGVKSGVRLRKRPFQPSSEPKAIALDFQLEAPFLPVRLRKIKTEIGGLGWIGHVTLRDGDVTSRRGIGM